MDPHTLAPLRRGVVAARIASRPQVLLPHAEQRLLGPAPGQEDANLGPRLTQRLAERPGQRLPEDLPLLGGFALGGLSYAIPFPERGMAVRTRTVPPADRRSRRRSSLVAIAAFALRIGTALPYGRGPRQAENHVAARMPGATAPVRAT